MIDESKPGRQGVRRAHLGLLFAVLLGSVATAQQGERLAPYAALRFRGDAPQVKHDGRWFDLLRIDGVDTAELMAFCRRQEGDRAKKRFAEDLVEMMRRMGHAPGAAVDLVLRDPASRAEIAIAKAAMTAENRQAVRRSWEDESRAAAGAHGVEDAPPRLPPVPAARPRAFGSLASGPALSPFAAMREGDDGLEVRVDDDAWHLWLAIDGVPAGEVVDWAKANADDWWKRITEDLPAVLTAMGHEPGATAALRVRSLATGREATITDVIWSSQKRRQLWEANKQRRRGEAATVDPEQPLSVAAWRADLVQLGELLDAQFAYRRLGDVDVAAALAMAAANLERAAAVTGADVAREVQMVIARFADGHAGVRSFEQALEPGFLPFLPAVVGDRVVAVAPARDRLVDDAHPFVVAIDGRPIADWLAAVDAFVPRGSPQYRRTQGLRLLRFVQFARSRLGLPRAAIVSVELADATGATTTAQLAVADRMPLFGDWPRGEGTRAIGDVGYLRLAAMADDEGFLDGIDAAMRSFQGTRGLVVDVRGNRGGSRAALLRLLPYLLAAEAPARVVNVAKPRTAGAVDGAVDLGDRSLHPLSWTGWTDREREAVVAAARAFHPEWEPPAADFGDWHWMVVERSTNPQAFVYGRPVVVLMDGDCFSATDVFLGALHGLPGVTLLGTPSGGGSARSRGYELANSGVRLRLASMASFRPDGRLYDGRGVEPDVVAEPSPGYFVGRDDPQLDAAIARLRAGR